MDLVLSSNSLFAFVLTQIALVAQEVSKVQCPARTNWPVRAAFRVHEPGIRVLFQSGYTDDMVVRHGILHADVASLQKPFTVDSLAKKIRDLLDQK